MIQIDNKLLVKLPEGAKVKLYWEGNNQYVSFWGSHGGWTGRQILPPGNWEIVGETKSITEEQAGYLLLRFPAKLKFNPFMSAVQNLHKWMEANKVPLEDNYLILIKK